MLQLMQTNLEYPLGLLISIVAVIAFGLLLYAARWVSQRRTESRAQNWMRVDATVYDTYQIDENAGATSAGTWVQFHNFDNSYGSEYIPHWAVAIRYSYGFAGEMYAGIYFLPETWSEGDLAAEAGRGWIGKKIVVRCNPDRPDQSCFLVEDGAPGEPYIPKSLAAEPYVTTLSLK